MVHGDHFRDHRDGEFYYFDSYHQTPGVTMENFDASSMLATINTNLKAPTVEINGGTIRNTVLEDVIINCGTF